MGRQKKNELDAILEQLKRSYAADADDELEDSLLETETSEEDAELASVLEKIFATTSDSDADSTDGVEETEETDAVEFADEEHPPEEKAAEEEVEETTDDTEEPVTVEDAAEEEVVEERSEEEISDHKNEGNTDDENTDLEEIAAHISKDDNSFEEERVDDVLKMMFHQDVEDMNGGSVEEDETGDSEKQPDSEEPASLSDSFTQEAVAEEDDEVEEETDEETDEKLGNDDDDVLGDKPNDLGDADLDEVITDVDEGSAFEYAEFDEFDDESPDESDADESLINPLEDDIVEEEPEEVITEEIPAKTMILDPKDYTVDILQHSLSDMSLFKPQNDIDFSIFDREQPESEEQTVAVEEPQRSVTKAEMNDNDVSLLLKFGYSGEIASSVGNEYAQAVVVDKNNEYVPQKHRITHGFTGKEFSGNAQIEEIKKKFRSDKTRLFVLSIIVSVIAAAMLFIDVFASLSFSAKEYVSLITMEVFLVVAMILILLKRIYSGILGLIRFETNSYSMLAVLLFEYLVYCLAMWIIYTISPVLAYSEIYVAFGGFVSIYAAFTVWAEYLDCCRENNAFNIMSDGDIHCILEKNIGEKNDSKHSDTAYNIKNTKFISGFFRRMFDRSVSNVKIVLTVGVIPFIAIVACVATAIFRDSVVLGMNAAGYVLFSAVPLSCVLLPALIEHIHSIKLGESHSAYIGIEAVEEYSKVDSLSFADLDAVEITALTEINPNKREESSTKWLNIASNVFEALGGPLSKTVHRSRAEESNIRHDTTINSIAENGIDLYFDSSMSVLIGDRQYMMAHNIRVKTDTNLSTAVKGVDRTVIYMAFDGTPQIGFIVTSRIKRSFLETVELLEKNKIKAIVNSYEPEINDYYFESNKLENLLSVHKPVHYEYSEPSTITDSGIIAPTSQDLCRTIIYSHEIIKDRARAKKTRVIQTVVGLVVAGLLVVLSCFTPSFKIIEIIQSSTLLIFYLVAALGLIPGIVQIVKLLKRK